MRVSFASHVHDLNLSLFFDTWDDFINTCWDLPVKPQDIIVDIQRTSPADKLPVTGRWQLPLLLVKKV